MEPKTSPARPSLLSPRRPLWQRILVWVAIAFVAINLLPALFLLPSALIDPALIVPLAIIGGAVALFTSRGGLALLRTGWNKPTANFTRRDDPSTGGYIYDVQPARASWLSILLPLPLFVFLAAFGVFSAWIFYAVVIFYLAFAGIIVLPGAQYRKPVSISVSPHGIHSDGVAVPLDQIAELEVGNNGVRVSTDPLVAGPNGVSTSGMTGRGLGRRQVARSFTLLLRSYGESEATVLAGGLTRPCIDTLAHDIAQVLECLLGTTKVAE